MYPKREYPFAGVIRSVSAKGGTISVQGPSGTDAIIVTDRTGIVKNGQRGLFRELAVGDRVRGAATVRPPSFRAVASSITIITSARR